VRRQPIIFRGAAGDQQLDLLIAESTLERMQGLLPFPELSGREAMLLKPCRAIHTFGMKYPIDVVFVSRMGEVLKVAAAVYPRRASAHLRAHAVIELRAGEAAASGICPGVTLPVFSLR